MNKEKIQQKQKAASERENNQNIIKYLEKAKRELKKQNATLRTINFELETKLRSSNRHLNNKSKSIHTREKPAKKIAQKALVYFSLTYCQKESKN